MTAYSVSIPPPSSEITAIPRTSPISSANHHSIAKSHDFQLPSPPFDILQDDIDNPQKEHSTNLGLGDMPWDLDDGIDFGIEEPQDIQMNDNPFRISPSPTPRPVSLRVAFFRGVACTGRV